MFVIDFSSTAIVIYDLIGIQEGHQGNRVDWDVSQSKDNMAPEDRGPTHPYCSHAHGWLYIAHYPLFNLLDVDLWPPQRTWLTRAWPGTRKSAKL
jgi:hypothetical protein